MTDEIVFGGDSADIPNGTYPATLTSVTTKTSAEFGDFRAWDFTLETGSVVGGGSSMATGARSKAGRWIVALLGRTPERGEAVGSAIIGRPCLVVVEEDAKGWPKVTSVLPPLAGPSQTPQDAPGRAKAAKVVPNMLKGDELVF